MERDDARGSEATEGVERERLQRGHDRGGEEQLTTPKAEDARRADVERHQREKPTDFVSRAHDDEGLVDDADSAARE